MTKSLGAIGAQKDNLQALQTGVSLLKTPYELYQWLTNGVSAVIQVKNRSKATITIEGAGATKKSKGTFCDDVYVLSVSSTILKQDETSEITLKASDWYNAETYVGISVEESDQTFLQGVCWDSKSETYLTTEIILKNEMRPYPKFKWNKDNKHGISNTYKINGIKGVSGARVLSTGAFTTIELY